MADRGGQQVPAFYRRKCCLLLSAMAFLLIDCTSWQTYPKSDHSDGQKFFNPVRVPGWSFRQLLSHVMDGHRVGDWPSQVHNVESGSLAGHASMTSELAVTHVNHSTVLIQIGGVNILTDPVWSMQVGPFGRFGPNRVRRPGIPFDRLPKIDWVLISHDHYDHLDIPTLKRLYRRDKPRVLVPLGSESFLKSQGIATARETDWWDEHRLDEETRIVFTPAQHSSGRAPWTRQRSLWGSFLVLQGEMSIYFAGDTGYERHFQSIRERFGPVDLALLPIGGYKPRSLHQSMHMDPVDAVHAHKDLQARYSVAIHHGTFQLSAESFNEPVDELRAYLVSQDRSSGEFLFSTEGMTLRFDQVGGAIKLVNAPEGS